MGDTSGFPSKRAKNTDAKIEDHKLSVYVWDMDETLILLKSLLNGTYAGAHGGSKDVEKGKEIGKMWEKLILDLCDDHFHYEQIENFNEPFLDSLSKFDDGRDLSDYDFDQDGFGPPKDDANKRKLAYRLRATASMYEKGLRNIFNQDLTEKWDQLYQMTDEFTDGWLSSARSFLDQCSSGKEDPTACPDSAEGKAEKSNSHCINVLVTSGSLIPSLAKCLLFRFDDLIKHRDVYSSWEVGKLQCFEWIKERFGGSNVQFCVIGDGWEECEAAEAMRWPFVQIDLRPNSSHRFPGLTLRTLGFYFSIVYGNRSTATDEVEE
ncbi:hypothetical protein BT93_E0208 [Corymbia citriodora subsp. variegata]|nr:hypothetical protein BT93_E0208 [Corymbia citriodora subsp. variegata]